MWQPPVLKNFGYSMEICCAFMPNLLLFSDNLLDLLDLLDDIIYNFFLYFEILLPF